MKNKFSIAMSLAVVLAMLFTTLALADVVTSDVVATAGNQTFVDLGNVSPGQVITSATSFQLVCNGNNHADLGNIVNVQFFNVSPSGNLTATNTTIGPIPAEWADDATGSSNCPSPAPVLNDNGGSVVTITAPTAAGTYNFVVTYKVATSDGIESNDITGSIPAVTFRITVVSPPSDTTPPVITKTISGTLGNNGWYTSDVTIDWTVTDPESSFTTVGCADTTINSDTSGSTSSCSATSAGGTSSDSVTIKRDATAPTLSLAFTPDTPDGNNGWWKTSGGVPFAWTCSDDLSGIDSSFAGGCPSPLSGTVTDQGTTNFSDQVKDLAGNLSVAVNRDLKLDNVAPVVTVMAARGADKNGWYNAPVSFDTVGSDATSSVSDANCTADQNYTGPDGTGFTLSGSCTDNAGNTGNGSSAAFNFDDTNPTLTWNDGPADGSSHYFGSVPGAPTCTASDTTSGPDTCGVTGHGTTVGSHTMTATAYDVAGNSYSEQRSYSVLAWTLTGFYQPVDMNGVLNTVKGGSTVPLKFEVFAGSTELTDTAVVSTLVKQVTCNAVAGEDTIEVLATGGTSLRYDTTGGQFIFNWQTPKLPGKCYSVTMTTQDGSSLTALFKLK